MGFLREYFRSLWHVVRLFTLGVGHARHRRLIEDVGDRLRAALQTPEPVEPQIPIVPFAELVSGVAPVTVLEPESSGGNITLFELTVLNHLVRRQKPKTLFEIGTFDGRTTLNLAANSDEDARVVTLDLPADMAAHTQMPVLASERVYIEKMQSGSRFRRTRYAEKIEQMFGDSASFDFAPYRERVDFVFVDGSHAYEYVRTDSATALGLLRNGRGLIVWHDYARAFHPYQGVTRALNELHAAGGAYRGMRWVKDTSLVVLEVAEQGTVSASVSQAAQTEKAARP